MPQPNWKKNDNGTIEDLDNDLMWVVRDSRQELGKWLNWDEGMAYVKACNDQNYLGHNDCVCRVKVRCVPFLKTKIRFGKCS